MYILTLVKRLTNYIYKLTVTLSLELLRLRVRVRQVQNQSRCATEITFGETLVSRLSGHSADGLTEGK